MSSPVNHLELTPAEKKKLKVSRVKVKEIHYHSVADLQKLLELPEIRAMELYALSEFQSLPSIGIRFAHDLISMGFYSLKELRDKDPARLTDKFERQIGAWIDPCVEDQFRLVVHYANNPTSNKTWWSFTPERKAFREKNGYPSSRPTLAWFELPQYSIQKRIPAEKESTQQDLHKKLKPAAAFMRKKFDTNISINQLAEVAGLSPYHFLRCFKSVYETTPLQYLTNIRLKEACQRLKKTQQDIDQIITACGFENKSSFIRLFKKAFKLTPMKFREACQVN